MTLLHSRYTRRSVLRILGMSALSSTFGLSFTACSKSKHPSIRPAANLNPVDDNGLALQDGFRSRIVARSGIAPIADSQYRWHNAPDAGGTFANADGGWIYVSNGEINDGEGGVGALRFDADGNIVDAYPILTHSTRNCGGGVTPWHTWLSGEEVEGGRMFECDPFGRTKAVVRLSLGNFVHEGAAVDTLHHHIYLTEDKGDGRFYRFVPASGKLHSADDLRVGQLQVAVVDESDLTVDWQEIPDPQSRQLEARYQVAASTPFNGCEGIVYQHGRIYFASKGDNRIWVYDTETAKLSLRYDASDFATPVLTGVDTLAISADGTVYVAEDQGNMQIVALKPDGSVMAVVQLPGHTRSEMTGPALSPDGTRLYFSSQRGAGGNSSDGLTYEITGPWSV